MRFESLETLFAMERFVRNGVEVWSVAAGGQLLEDGRFRGGSVPYGYGLCKVGRMHKRSHEVYELQIDDDKGAVVKEVFLPDSDGLMGTHEIAPHLTDKAYPEVPRIIGIPSIKIRYCKATHNIGILKSGGVFSECIKPLRIIDDATFYQA